MHQPPDARDAEGYRETEMCIRCQGSCCRRQSGHCLPSEFSSAEAVKAAVASGRYGIVLLLDTDIMARVIRPSYKDLQMRAGCIFHHDDGCELPFEMRPHGCRMLEPRGHDGGRCTPQGIPITEAAHMWEESGFLPDLKACLENYPMLRLGRPSVRSGDDTG